MPAEVRHNVEASRYELVLEGRVIGVADYRDVGGNHLVFPHTEIERPLRGQGFGDQLIKGALDDVRRIGRTLVRAAGRSPTTSRNTRSTPTSSPTDASAISVCRDIRRASVIAH